MDWHTGDAEENEDVTMGEEEDDYTSDHIICLIDARAHMFEEDPHTHTDAFTTAINIVRDTLKHKIVEDQKNTVGVILFGTRNKKSEMYDNVYELIDLDIPSVASVHMCTQILNDFDGITGGAMEAHEPAQCPLKHAIFACTQTFVHKCGSDKRAQKRVWLFTNDDDPLTGSTPEADIVVQRAKDAVENGVELSLFHMHRPSAAAPFDVDKFYKQIIVVDDEEYLDFRVSDAARSHADLASRVLKKMHRKRCLARLPLVISQPTAEAPDAPDLKISMQLIVTLKQTKLTAVKMDGRVNQLAVSRTRTLSAENGNVLEPHDISTYMNIGNSDRAPITSQEMKSMKSWGEAGVTIIGFVHRSWMKPWYQVKDPYFLYPDEGSVKGSTAAASALLTSMLQKGQIAITRFVRTANSGPVMAALIPQEEEIDEDTGLQCAAPGFNLITLPFADDVREVKFATAPPPPPPQVVEKAQRIVRALTLNASSCLELGISNPLLQKQYHTLEKIAIQEEAEDMREPKDELKADEEVWTQLQASVDDFTGSLAPLPEKGSKRKAGGDGASGMAKKSKSEPAVDGSGVHWQAAVAENKVQKQTVPNLKQFLRSKQLPLGGKKPDLVQRVYDYFNKAS